MVMEPGTADEAGAEPEEEAAAAEQQPEQSSEPEPEPELPQPPSDDIKEAAEPVSGTSFACLLADVCLPKNLNLQIS